MKKKLIIFDMDGVLFDSIGFGQKNFIKLHPGVTNEMYKEISIGNYHEEVKKYAHLKIEQTEEEKNKHKLVYAKNKSKSQMFIGVKSLLEDLHNSAYILALNTGSWERNCLPLLEKSGIKSLFDFIATADSSKSKTEKFKLIKDKYNFEGKDVLFVTDSLGDVREADVAGIPTIAVTWGVHDRSYFERETHTNLIGIIDSVAKLRDFIHSNDPSKKFFKFCD